MLGSVYALVAVAFTFTMGVLKFLNFSIPGIFMVAGMVTWAMLKGGIGLLLAVPAALALGAVLSYAVERLIQALRSAQISPRPPAAKAEHVGMRIDQTWTHESFFQIDANGVSDAAL